MQPRWYQQRCHDEAWAHFDSGKRAVVIVCPTGAGKSYLGSMSINRVLASGGRTLFLAHRKELLEQPAALLQSLGVRCGFIMGGKPSSPGAPVQVASVQALTRRDAPPPPASLLIIDEAHRAKARSYLSVLEKYDEHGMPRPLVLGLTATPWRLDGQPLRDIFEAMVVGPSIRELVAEGNLIAPTVHPPDPVDVSAGTIRLLPQWQRFASGLRTIVFAPDVERSLAYVEEFRGIGVAAAHVDGTTPSGQREQAIRSLASGRITVLCNVDIATEGLDVPSLECVALTKRTDSLTKYLQQVGRVMRPHESKRACVLLDCAGVSLDTAFGLPWRDRVWSLDTDEAHSDGEAGGSTIAIVCGECFAAYEAPPYGCPHCGAAPGRLGRDAPTEVDGTLGDGITIERDIGPTACPKCRHTDLAVGPLGRNHRRRVQCRLCGWSESVRDEEAAANASTKEIMDAFGYLCAQAKRSGYKPGWVVHRIKARYPEYCAGKDRQIMKEARKRVLG